MFLQLFRYRLKCLLRDRLLIFWTLVFPILLGTFFNMAFMNLNNDEKFEPISAALVTGGGANDAIFEQTVHQMSLGKDRLFNLKTTASKHQADQWLKKGKIKGYFTDGPLIRLYVQETGISQSIMKTFADHYRQNSSAFADIAKANPEAIQKGLLDDLSQQRNSVKEVNTGGAKPNNVLNYFYTLIAMACLYGSFWGNKEVCDTQADLSSRAARLNLAPVHKLKLFLAGCCADLLIIYGEILILLAFLHFILGIDFGTRTGLVLLTAWIGSMLGLTFGTFVSAITRKGENLKFAVLTAVTMAGCFLAGMMIGDMKYLVAEYVPALAWLNPANLLTDAFYSLYYYDSLNHYLINLAMIAVFTIVFGFGTYLMIRRRKYANL